jgi:hypothetical protein
MDACKGRAKRQSAFPCRPAGNRGQGRMMESQMRSHLMETTMRRSFLLSCGILTLLSIYNSTSVWAQALPDGAAVPLGELQENLHVGEGVPLADRPHGASVVTTARIDLIASEEMPVGRH